MTHDRFVVQAPVPGLHLGQVLREDSSTERLLSVRAIRPLHRQGVGTTVACGGCEIEFLTDAHLDAHECPATGKAAPVGDLVLPGEYVDALKAFSSSLVGADGQALEVPAGGPAEEAKPQAFDITEAERAALPPLATDKETAA